MFVVFRIGASRVFHIPLLNTLLWLQQCTLRVDVAMSEEENRFSSSSAAAAATTQPACRASKPGEIECACRSRQKQQRKESLELTFNKLDEGERG